MTRQKRAWGGGTVFLHKGLYWTVAIRLAPTPDGKRRRKYIRYPSREEAEAALPGLLAEYAGADVASATDIRRRLPRATVLPLLSTHEAIRLVLERGRVLGWDDDMVASAALAAMRPRRLRYGVTGPCGSPNNVVSACMACNVAKGRRTPAEWRMA